jgi:hypothetical protein
MMRRVALATSVALALAAGALVSMTRSDGFPHVDHAGLFPTCLGCHSGIPEGEEELWYSVVPADCIQCHDGEREETVNWDAPTRTVSNMVYDHLEHITEVEAAGDSALVCADCHGPFVDSLPRMDVGRAPPESCVACHAHEVSEHLAAEAECSACHVTLADSPDLSVERLAEFPEPPSHESEAFLLEHGGEGPASESCAVCHARETCSTCHLNAETLDEIRRLAPDERVAQLVEGMVAEWPEPPSHERADWEFTHGNDIDPGSQSCASCHAEPSCRTCHGSAPLPEIAALPTPGAGDPIGVVVPRTRPPGHLPLFATQHGAAVATDMPSCSSCHVETQCAECHSDPGRVAETVAPQGAARADVPPGSDAERYVHADPGFRSLPPEPRSGYHPANFLLRHGAEALAVQTVCSDCHSTEAFCRDCHASTGITVGVAGGAGGAFHDAQPNWFFEHGVAARQGMEGCASCHQQTSCLRCHSAKVGLRISPHGPDFDANRVGRRSSASCGICHTGRQLAPEP